jgi:hypothetical protein
MVMQIAAKMEHPEIPQEPRFKLKTGTNFLKDMHEHYYHSFDKIYKRLIAIERKKSAFEKAAKQRGV